MDLIVQFKIYFKYLLRKLFLLSKKKNENFFLKDFYTKIIDGLKFQNHYKKIIINLFIV